MYFVHRVVDIPEATLGVNAANLSATTNSNWIECREAWQLVLEVDVVNTTGAALAVVAYLETRRFGEATTVARREAVMVDAAPAAGIVYGDLYQHPMRWQIPAVATTYRLAIPVPVTFETFRLGSINAAAAGVGDTISVHGRLVYR